MLLQIDFPHQGPFGDELYEAFNELARDIGQEPGFIWKLWTENSQTQEAGGIYLFDSEASAQNYLKKHTTRLESFGVENIRGKLFNINDALSQITHWPPAKIRGEISEKISQ